MSGGPRVTVLSVTPIKGTRLQTVDHVQLTETGAAGDRVFCLIDDRGRMLNGKNIAALQTVVTELTGDQLSLTFPDGTRVAGEVGLAETVQIRFFSKLKPARRLEGPWAEALSDHFGRALRVVAPEVGVDRGRAGAASLISSGSLRRLAEQAETDHVDARRFRMLIEIDGVAPHEEDRWVGRRVRVGGALIAWHGHVGRCLITARDPETAASDLPTLDLLGAYRREERATEPLPFGIHGAVVEPGPVRVGDPVALTDG